MILSKLGETHPNTAVAYNNLGNAYKNKGEYNKAIEYLEKSLLIFSRQMGNDHPYTKGTKRLLEDIRKR